MNQVILPWLPGYMFDGKRLLSTGVALPPTQHIDKRNGEVIYYTRPIFDTGSNVGLFIRHQGLIDWVNKSHSTILE
jgi:hypothetical protein